MAYLLGLDISTTGAKALLIDESGSVVASATNEYGLSCPQPLWSEQSPEDWWVGASASIRAALAQAGLSGAEVSAVGLTGQMHGLVLLDRDGQVVRPAILWNDQRTGDQCAGITERVGGESRVLELTGNLVLPGFTAPKLAWLRKHEPETLGRTAHFLLPKDYVRLRLTGEYATDVSDASGTALFDVEHRRWSRPMLDLLQIPVDWLPRCGESCELSGRISARAARETGLQEGTPVAAGAGDQAAQAAGTGIVRSGVVAVTCGTSGVVFAHADQYVRQASGLPLRPEAAESAQRLLLRPEAAKSAEGLLHSFCHAVPGKWHLMGVMLSAGGSLRWFRDQLGQTERELARREGRDPYELLTAEAEPVPAGSEGLLFLPYLTGERTPYADPLARGAWVGLTQRHSKGHLVRAVLEGVSFGLRDCLELVQESGVPVREIRASGGGARSRVWRQIQADVFGHELRVVNVTEGAAYGAALLAGVCGGTYGSVEQAVEATVRVTDTTEPIPENVALYERLYPLYRDLYHRLAPVFHELSQGVQ